MTLQDHTLGARDGHCYWARQRQTSCPLLVPLKDLLQGLSLFLSASLARSLTHKHVCVFTHMHTQTPNDFILIFPILMQYHLREQNLPYQNVSLGHKVNLGSLFFKKQKFQKVIVEFR